jgi:arylsulfatase A-like enzyme
MQRHLLQVGYTDHALGTILDSLEDTGRYDEAMIVVVADQGISVKPGVAHQRQIADDTVGEIAAIPLFVKLPGQTEGSIDDRRALTIDIVPTIADVLGTDVPWTTDGSSLVEDPPSRTETTTIGPYSTATFGTDGEEKYAVARRLEALFPGGDPYALVPPGAADLVGETIDVKSLPEAPFDFELDNPLLYTAYSTTSDIVPSRVTGALLGTVQGDEIFAVTIDGRVAAMTRSYIEDDEGFFQAMIPPESLAVGYNEVDLVLVGADGSYSRVDQANRP